MNKGFFQKKIALLLIIFLILALIPSTSFGAGITWNYLNVGLDGAETQTLAIAPNGTNLMTGIQYGAGIFRSTDSASSWQRANTGLTQFNVLIVTYLDNTTAYIGVENQGVYKTLNNGDNWIDASTGLPTSGDPTSLKASPDYSSDNTLFLATQSGVYRSTTAVESWSEAGTALSGENIYDLVISPDYTVDGAVFAAARPGTVFDGGVWKWTNASGDWVKIYDGSLTDVYIEHLAISPNFASDQTLFAGSGSGLYKSTNGGVGWTKLISESVNALALSPNYQTDGTILFSSTYSGPIYKVYKSTDWGATWDDAFNGLPNITIMDLAFDPAYSPSNLVIYAATDGEGIFRTIDGAASWVPATAGIIPQIKDLVHSPDYNNDQTLFVGSWGGGVHKSNNGGASWMKSGLSNLWVEALAISPNYGSDQTLFAGADSGVYKTVNGGLSWVNKSTGITNRPNPALAISPDYAVDQTVFAGSRGGYGDGVFKTTNGGDTWVQEKTGFITNPLEDHASIWSLAISPGYTNDQTIFAGLYYGDGVFKSTNGGLNWTQVLDAVSALTLGISPDYGNDGTIFAGTLGSGVYRSQNFGSSWTQVLNKTNAEFIHQIVLSPNFDTDGIVYAAAGGNWLFNRPGEGGIWRSIDGGDSWVRIYEGLSDPSSEAVLIDPTDISHAFVGTYQMGILENEPTFSDINISHWAFWYVELLANTGVTGGYPDGTYGPENRVTRAEMAVFLLNALGISPGPLPVDSSFSDIEGHWAETFIEELKDQGITGGYPDGTYRPDNRVTRAEMAVFLLNALGITPGPLPVDSSFSDIEGHWAEIFIEELADQGITGGYPDGTYRPENRVTRAEMAVFLVKGFDLP